MTTEFTDRNAEILRLYEEEKLTLQEIGDRLGISRERVRQLLDKMVPAESRRPPNTVLGRRKQEWIEKHREEVIGRLLDGEPVVGIQDAEAVPRTWVEAIWRELSEDEQRIAGLRMVARTEYGVTSNEGLLDYMRAAAQAKGTPLTFVAYEEWRRERGAVGGLTIVTRFGSWYAASIAAGLFPNASSHPPRKFSDEECLEAVRRVEAKAGRIPSVSDYDEHHLETDPSAVLVRQRFGGWLGVLRALGKEL